MAVDVEHLRIDRNAMASRRSPLTTLAVTLVLAAAAIGVGLMWPEPTANGAGGKAGPSPTTGGRDVRTVQVPAPGSGGDVVGGGWIEVAPPAPFVISARVAGRIIELPFLQGDRVAKGAVVARLDPAPLTLRRAQAVAALQVAERRLATLRAGSRPQEIAAAAADLRGAEAERDRAAKAVARAKRLAPSGAVSESELQAAEAADAAARAAVDRAAARLALLEAGTRPEAIAEGEAAVAVAQAAADAAAQQLAWTELRAPVDGVVLERFAHVGEAVGPSLRGAHGPGAILSLFDPADLQVRVDLPQADAAQVVVGNAVAITLDAAPGRTFAGAVVRIDPRADLAKNTVRVRVKLAAADPALRPDLTARVAFRTAADTGATIRIPARCVVSSAGASHVWAVTGGAARRVAVTLGRTSGAEVVVESGLSGGETLVLDPPADLTAGEPVQDTGGGPR